MEIDGEPKLTIITPNLDFTIFEKNKSHIASFQIPTPIPLLQKLANDAETQYTTLNNTETNPKCKTYYFYCYFKAFLIAAAKNDEIYDLSQSEAIKKITQTPVEIHFLARIITFFNINNQTLISLPEIQDKYKSTFYPQAQQIIYEKFKIIFKKPNKLDTSLLFNPTHPKTTTIQTSFTDNTVTKTLIEQPTSSKKSYAKITSQSF
jgi:hypothetical protein